MKAVLEGILFVVGDEGVTINDICNILEINEEDAKKLVLELKNDYLDCNRGLRIDYLGNSIKLTTKKEHKEYYKKLIEEKNNVLSQAALETLAIIVYNEPITRIKVDEDSSIGHPILYKTTDDFLDYFGLSSKEDLPKIDDSIKNEDETDLFLSKYSENNDVNV